MKKKKIPTIVGVLILIVSLAAGVALVQVRQVFRLGASSEASPKDVRISNITDKTLTVTWTSDKNTNGFVKWGENDSSLSKVQESTLKDSSAHSVTLTGLTPNKKIYFKVNSNGVDFDNNGSAWEGQTGSVLSPPVENKIISGSILNSSGQGSKNTVVYINVSGSLLSTTTSENGSYLTTVSLARTPDLSGYFPIDDDSTLLEISAQLSPSSVATAVIYPKSAKPIPTMVLGNSYDFKNSPVSQNSEIPSSSIGTPPEKEPESGFDVSGTGGSPAPAGSVTLTSHENGEVVTSTEPEFFGEAPAGITLTITVESDPVTENVKVPSSGDWKWSPPEGLSEGTHKITVSWRDANGILRSLVRTFVVQASEGPAFVSTPSATPTNTPTATPKASNSPTPTVTVSPSPTTTISPTVSSAPATPESGSLTPTILLSIMGIGAIIASFLVFNKVEN